MRMRWISSGALITSLVLAAAGHAGAQGPKPTDAPAEPPAVDANTLRGREAFVRGLQRSKESQWGEALAAFEEAAAARDAPVVQYNIAYCQRALGRYVAARRTFRQVLEKPEGLATSQVDDSKVFVSEMDKLIVHVALTLDPQGAKLTVDGRPLQAVSEGGATVFVALAGGAATSPPAQKTFNVDLDPGVHLFRAVRDGHLDAFVQKTYRPGEKTTLDLHLDTLPARVAVASEPKQAIVRVDGREAGLTPIEIERGAGKHTIEVVLSGYETFSATLDLHAGQRNDQKVTLVPVSVLKKYREVFIVGGLLLAGGVAGVTATLVAKPPDYDGGSLKWVAKPTALQW